MALHNSGENLRGRNFKGQDLTGRNFSYADIRGANFTNTNLTGANFSHAKAGLQQTWKITYIALFSLLFLLLSGFFLYLIDYFVPLIFKASSLEKQIAGCTTLILLIAFFLRTIFQGVGSGLEAFAFAFTGAVGVAASIKGGTVAAFTGAALEA